MKLENTVLVDSIKNKRLCTELKNDKIHTIVKNVVNGSNVRISSTDDGSQINYDKEIVEKFMNDERNEIIKNSDACYDFICYILDNVARIDNIDALNDFLAKNKKALYDIVNVYGIGSISSIIDYAICQNALAGFVFDEFSDLRCDIFEKINKFYYDDYLKNESWNTMDTTKSYLYNYMYYLAVSDAFNDMDHYNYLFYLLSKYDVEKLDSRMDAYWLQILHKYIKLMAKTNGIDNLVVLFDYDAYGVDRGSTSGYLDKIGVDNRLYYVININYPSLVFWKRNLNTANHEFEHVKFEYNKVSFDCFLYAIDYYAYDGVKPELRDKYRKDNYRRTYTEYVAHRAGYSFEKKLEENSQFINLNRIDQLNRLLEENSKYEECNYRIVGEKEYSVFSLFRKGIRNELHLSFLKHGFNFKKKAFIHPILKFILDDNYEILPYDTIKCLYNDVLVRSKNNPDDDHYLELIKIYEWTLKNYNLSLEPIDDKNDDIKLNQK